MTHPLLGSSQERQTAICMSCGRPGFVNDPRPRLNIISDLCWWCWETAVLAEGEVETLL